MISKIYDSNKILFKSGTRKGDAKEEIQRRVDSQKVNKPIKKLKVKTKKKPSFNQEMLDMYERSREKRRNERRI